MSVRPELRKLKRGIFGWMRAVAVGGAIAMGLSGCVYAAYARGVPFTLSHDYFRLRSIRVACDNPAVSPQELARRAKLYAGTNIWDIDPETTARELERAAWVREAQVERRFPNQVTVQVFRRRPVAATMTESGAYLVDTEGALFREVSGPRFPDLPYLTGWGSADTQGERAHRLRTLAAVLEEVAGAGFRLSQVDVDEAGQYWVYPDVPAVAVKLGDPHGAAGKLARLDTVIDELGGITDGIDFVDVSHPARVVVRAATDRIDDLLVTGPSGRQVAGGGRAGRG